MLSEDMQVLGPEHEECTAQITVLRQELVQRTEELRKAREELGSVRSHVDEGLAVERQASDQRLEWVVALVRAAGLRWDGGGSHRNQVAVASMRIQRLAADSELPKIGTDPGLLAAIRGVLEEYDGAKPPLHLFDEAIRQWQKSNTEPGRVPRVWRKGDPEPAGAVVVRSASGRALHRDRAVWTTEDGMGGGAWWTWLAMDGPLTEVLDVPAPAEQAPMDLGWMSPPREIHDAVAADQAERRAEGGERDA